MPYNLISFEIINLTNLLKLILFSGPVQVVSISSCECMPLKHHAHIFICSVKNISFSIQLCYFRMLYYSWRHTTTLVCQVIWLTLEEKKELQNFRRLGIKTKPFAIQTHWWEGKPEGAEGHLFKVQYSWDTMCNTHRKGNLIPAPRPPPQGYWAFPITHSFMPNAKATFPQLSLIISCINSSYQQKQTSTLIPTTPSMLHINNYYIVLFHFSSNYFFLISGICLRICFLSRISRKSFQRKTKD